NRLYAYGTGGPVSLRYDRDILKHYEEEFVANAYRVLELLRALSLSDAFSSIRPALTTETVAAGNPRTNPSLAINQALAHSVSPGVPRTAALSDKTSTRSNHEEADR
ncbi:MAG: hypothetical protein NWP69_03480, partial [Congregibacter sp.]|nr:hypothetical protein [Congregibacter sp.]